MREEWVSDMLDPAVESTVMALWEKRRSECPSPASQPRWHESDLGMAAVRSAYRWRALAAVRNGRGGEPAAER